MLEIERDIADAMDALLALRSTFTGMVQAMLGPELRRLGLSI